MIEQRRQVRNLAVGNAGYVSGIVDHALTEEQRNVPWRPDMDKRTLGYTADEWKAQLAGGVRAPLRLDHGEEVGQLVQTSVDDQRQLWVHALFDLGTKAGKDTWERVTTGEIHSFSAGFNALPAAVDPATTRYANRFKEVSVTSNPRKKHALIKVRRSTTAGADESDDDEPDDAAAAAGATPPVDTAAAVGAPPTQPVTCVATDATPPTDATPTDVAPPTQAVTSSATDAPPTDVALPGRAVASVAADVPTPVGAANPTPAPVPADPDLGAPEPVQAEPMAVDVPAQAADTAPPQVLEADALQPAFTTAADEQLATPMSTQDSSAPMAVDAPAAVPAVSASVPAAAPTQTPAPVVMQTPVATPPPTQKAAPTIDEAELNELRESAALYRVHAEAKAKKAAERRAKAAAERAERMRNNSEVLALHQQAAGFSGPEADMLLEEMTSNDMGAKYVDAHVAMAKALGEAEVSRKKAEAELQAYREQQEIVGYRVTKGGDAKRVAASNAQDATPQEVRSMLDWRTLPQRAAERAARNRASNSTPLAPLAAALDQKIGQLVERHHDLVTQDAAEKMRAADEAAAAEDPEEYAMYENAQDSSTAYDALYRMYLKGLPMPTVVQNSATNQTFDDAEQTVCIDPETRESVILPDERVCSVVAEALFGKHSKYIDALAADKPRMAQLGKELGYTFAPLKQGEADLAHARALDQTQVRVAEYNAARQMADYQNRLAQQNQRTIAMGGARQW
jgi:hypothetical protein